MARGKQRDTKTLAEKVRSYPSENNLSNEAIRVFKDTYKVQHKLMGAQPGFVAAKIAVEEIPKDRRFRKKAKLEEEE